MMVGAALLVFTGITVAAERAAPRGAGGDHGGADHRDDEGIDGRVDLHAPEPREEVDLRLAAAHRRRLHHPDDGADLHDHGQHRHAGSGRRRAPRPSIRSTEMSLRAFHLLFIALSVVLAAFCAAWSVGHVSRGARDHLCPGGGGVASVSVVDSACTARRFSARPGSCSARLQFGARRTICEKPSSS